jgi:hypothetical protein
MILKFVKFIYFLRKIIKQIKKYYFIMNSKISIISITIFSIIKLCYFYPSGAPVESCGSMFPDHNVDPIEDKPPYTVSIEPNSNSPSFNGNTLKSSLKENFYINLANSILLSQYFFKSQFPLILESILMIIIIIMASKVF